MPPILNLSSERLQSLILLYTTNPFLLSQLAASLCALSRDDQIGLVNSLGLRGPPEDIHTLVDLLICAAFPLAPEPPSTTSRIRRTPPTSPPRYTSANDQPSTQKFYVVYFGRKVGVYEDWNRAQANLHQGDDPDLPSPNIYEGIEGLDPAVESLQAARKARGKSPHPWYAVFEGYVPGVYNSWLACAMNVEPVRRHRKQTARWKGYDSFQQAQQAFDAKVAAREVVVFPRQ
ncbi:hypothetical protein C8F01DRAFT_1115599 [Mycena amicta]|nr:hypothetical protein C8F01DRAFT_1115599 [Mycena amicta]